jgi:hypothetical protein
MLSTADVISGFRFFFPDARRYNSQQIQLCVLLPNSLISLQLLLSFSVWNFISLQETQKFKDACDYCSDVRISRICHNAQQTVRTISVASKNNYTTCVQCFKRITTIKLQFFLTNFFQAWRSKEDTCEKQKILLKIYKNFRKQGSRREKRLTFLPNVIIYFTFRINHFGNKLLYVAFALRY